MPKALEGTRVVDLTRMLPGPYASMILANLGAEIIKIEEPPLGDPTRWSPRHRSRESSTFELINRGKKSLALNLKSIEGVEIFRKLARGADIVLEGFRPGVMDRLGIGFGTLSGIEPRLILCSISGYGQDGPMQERSGHDVNYLALAGVLGLQTDSSGNPVLSGIQVADLGGALFAVIGILAALAARSTTGKGQRVDVSMMDAAIALLPVAAARLFAGEQVLVGARLSLSGKLACYNIYATRDGRHLSVGALEPKFWERFCGTIGRPEFVPLQTAEGEAQQRMIEEVRAIIRTRTLREWSEVFAKTDACVEPVLSLEESFRLPQVAHRKTVTEADDGSGHKRSALNLPFRLSGTPSLLGDSPPRLGQHTRLILRDLGYTDKEIDALIAKGVIAEIR